MTGEGTRRWGSGDPALVKVVSGLRARYCILHTFLTVLYSMLYIDMDTESPVMFTIKPSLGAEGAWKVDGMMIGG